MAKPIRGQLLKGHLDLLVLAALSDDPAHGYSIVGRLRRLSEGTFDLSEGTLYPALYRLERTGLLESDWAVAGGRQRRVYRVTDRGRVALGERIEEWERLAGALGAVLTEVVSR